MTRLYLHVVSYWAAKKKIFLPLIAAVLALFASRLPLLRYDFSETLWLTQQEAAEHFIPKGFLLLAFNTVKGAPPPARAAADLCRALQGVPGIRQVSDARGLFLSASGGRMPPADTGVLSLDCGTINLGGPVLLLKQGIAERLATVPWLGPTHLLGQTLFYDEVMRVCNADFSRSIPLAFLACFAFLVLVYRHWLAALIPIACTAAALTCAFGLSAIVGVPVTVNTTILPALALVLCSNDSVYMMNAASESKEALGRMVWPCLQTSLFLVIGFSSMLLTDIRPVRYLGCMCLMTIGFSVLIAVFVLPVIFLENESLKRTRAAWIGEGAWRRFYLRIFGRRGLYLAPIVALTLVSACLLPRLKVDSDALSYFRNPNDVIRSLGFFRTHGLPTDTFTVRVWPSAGIALSPSDQEKMASAIGKLPGITGVLDSARIDSMVRFSGAKGGGDGGLNALAKEFHGGQAVRLDVYDQFISTHEYGQFLEGWKGIFRPYKDAGYKADFSGGVSQTYLQERRLVSGQVQGFMFANLAISLLFISFFGWSVGLVATLENLLPVLLTMALCVALGMNLNFSSVLIANVVLGLAAEDTLYLLVRRKAALKRGLESREAFVQSASEVGNSSVISSVMMIFAFLMLLISPFRPSMQLGFLAAFAVAVALAADLVVLPFLLEAFAKRRLPQ